ncbi:hypothetical protein AKJ62_02525 [candidate division MSBL1 archaeon SCGC-AAA259D14]|uniref:Uncharacterized protein n=2 Tax=candidate division MSBL1 TaxID=215777 RepID=A0A133U6B6_9EURY|nr:hypothetical protein AKJ62_02525 [candidate division MSBL1 archaeon SCGC-AAA259D14]KXA93809.1 hypothetical protein AKJ66_00870 [candidate division MSBL1 archaeon SCGC-AAA259E22]
MSRPGRKYEEENSELIKSFIRTMELQDNYEVWFPYSHGGKTGFIDLILKSRRRPSVFKFLKNGKKLKQTVKELKLETILYKRSRDTETEDVYSYLVINDNKRNRKSVLYQYGLLANQPFEILFLNQTEERIESITELKENIPKLFQTEDIRLGKGALRKLISRPNHGEIERAILGLENPPDEVTGSLVDKMDRYLQNNKKMPERILVSQKDLDNRARKTYRIV